MESCLLASILSTCASYYADRKTGTLDHRLYGAGVALARVDRAAFVRYWPEWRLGKTPR